MRTLIGHAGFTLVEALVAVSLLATLAAGFLPLLAQTRQFLNQSELVTAASMAASARAEQLLAVPWEYDGEGLPAPAPSLASSPAGSLEHNAAGYHDWIDDSGQRVAGASPGMARLVRRWAIVPVPVATGDALAIEVCIFAAAATTGAHPMACVATVRVRQP